MYDEERGEQPREGGEGEADGPGYEVGAGSGSVEEEIPPEVLSAHSRYGSEMITIMEPDGVPSPRGYRATRAQPSGGPWGTGP